MTKIILKTNKICKSFNNKKVLDMVSINIRQGEIVTIIGPNGGGKSTLAKILVNIIKPDSGEIWCTPNLKIGYMPQNINLNSSIPISVKSFLELNCSEHPSEIEHIASRVGINKILNQSMHKISGGEAQRVMLARALLNKPELLILDEPEQKVDINGQIEIYNLLQELNRTENMAILIISHDLYLVMKSSNHVVCLNHHICCEGMPENLSKDEAYINLFGKDAVKTLAIYPHNHNHHHHISEN